MNDKTDKETGRQGEGVNPLACVWKFPINFGLAGGDFIEMPQGAQILTVQLQKGVPCLWAVVNPDAPKELRLFEIVGTGHPMRLGSMQYVGTFQLYVDELVFHVFERLR